MEIHNVNCDGSFCASNTGQVRVYPLGGGANLILCRACWEHENRYRAQRGRDTGAKDNWPTVEWEHAEVYGQ